MVNFRFEIRAIRGGTYFVWDTQESICTPHTFGQVQQLGDLGLLNSLQFSDDTLSGLLKNAPVPEECGGIGDPIVQPPPQPPPPEITKNEVINVSWVFPSNDEIEVLVSIRNKTNITREYRAFVYNWTGAVLDKEPDFFFENIKAGMTENIIIRSTFDATWDVNSVFPQFRVGVHEQNTGEVANIIVDLQKGSVLDVTGGPQTTQKGAPVIEEVGISGSGGAVFSPPAGKAALFGLGGAGLALAIGAAVIFSKR